MAPEVVIAETVFEAVASVHNINLLFKKQDSPTFDRQRQYYSTFKGIWRESVAVPGSRVNL